MNDLSLSPVCSVAWFPFRHVSNALGHGFDLSELRWRRAALQYSETYVEREDSKRIESAKEQANYMPYA